MATEAVLNPAVPTPAQPSPLSELKTIPQAKGFPFVIAVVVVLGILFLPLFRFLPEIWFAPDSAYSHGPLVPLIAGYIALTRADKFRAAVAKPSWIPIVLLIPTLYAVWVANRTEMMVILSAGLVATIGWIIWAWNGWAVARHAVAPVLYLFFGLPVWTAIVDKFTQPMQEISAKVAYAMLQALGFKMYRADSTTIMLDNFQMVVGAPCSGLKMIISLVALMVFFMLIANLKWWANLTLAVFVIPFAILINGLRIMMIGVIGNTYGSDAGHQFHDYSGYIALFVCIFVLQKVCRALGWK